MREEQEGKDVETAEDALTRHVQMHDQLRKAPQNTVREGNELLRTLEQVKQVMYAPSVSDQLRVGKGKQAPPDFGTGKTS